MRIYSRCEGCVYLEEGNDGEEVCGLANYGIEVENSTKLLGGCTPVGLGNKWLFGVTHKFPCNTFVKYKLSCTTCKYFCSNEQICELTGSNLSEREPFLYATHCFAHEYDSSKYKCFQCTYFEYWMGGTLSEIKNNPNMICARKLERVDADNTACEYFSAGSDFGNDCSFVRDCTQCEHCDTGNSMFCKKFNISMLGKETNRFVNDCIFYSGYNTMDALKEKERKLDEVEGD